MKNTKLRKALSVFLSVLMLMSCWVWVAPTDASAANSYYVRVYLNIYDGANSDGYGKAYSVVDDINSEFYGKPNEYKWDYGSSWNAFDNSDGYDGEVNMAGFTLFYDNDKKYKAYDLSADLVAATTTLGNNWTSMDDLTLENFAAWPNKVEKVYSFNLDSMPSSLFWINDENNAVNGETSFGIHKITVAESSTSQEHILWTGLSGSESYYECYYGTITPTGLITPWDDCPGEATKTFYKDYTTSAVGTWIDPFNAGDYNVYPVNNYLSGGVSATFTVGSNGAQTNIDYIELGNTNNYYINFTNHSTQTATITALNSSNLVNGYSNNLTIAPGETKSFTLKKASMSGDGNYYNFCFKYTLNNVFEKNGTTPVEFYQAAYIGTWNTSDDSSVIGPPTSSEANSGFTVYNGTDMDFMNQFMADTGIFETVSTTGNRTSNIKFKYNYYLDNTDTKYTNWSQTGLRMYVKKWTYNVTVYFQPDTNDGTMNLVGSIGNEDTASLSIADMVYSYSSPSDTFKTPDSSNRPWAYYNRPCVPQWARSSSMEWGTVTSNSTVAYFRFCGNIFEGSKNSSEPGIIRFTDMKWKSTNNNVATFNGDINVYVFDKTDLRNYVRNIGELGANWAPMRNRFNDTQWNAYENALSNAMTVLANQKTNQKAVTDAYNNLVSACEALKSTANLTSQVAEVTYTKRIADYNSEATDTTSKYLIMPIGTETAVPAYDTYKHTTSGTVVAKQSSNLKTNFTQYETGINPIDYRYWKIDFAGVDEALTAATNLLNTPLEEYKDTYYEEVQVARTTLSSIDRDSDTYYPTHQSDVTDALAELNALLAHNSTETVNHQFIEDDKGDYVVEFDETTHWYECEVCGYKYMHENHTTTATPDSNDANSHIVECTYVDKDSGNTCDFVMTEPHTFTNPELARPTLVDGVWKNGTYTYTCTCGATKTETAKRADYSELEEAIKALEGIKNDENLSDEAKTVINNAIAKGEGIAQNLVTAEQDQIDNLVKELQKVKADADEAIKNKELGVEKITEATSGVKVQFIDKSGLGTIESVQLGKDDGFKIRVANGNADSNITITEVKGDGISETADQTIESGKSVDLDVTMPTTAGIKEYTITYTIDGLRDAEGNAVEFTTKAYLYVKGEAYKPYHLMDETCNNGPATAKWEYSLESSVGDFAPVYNNKAPKAEFGNSNLVVDKDWVRPVYHKYDYEDNKCFAECTGTGDKPYVKGDAHAATYRYYIDTSLAPTWQEAGFKAVIAEGVESKYDYAAFDYIRLANNMAYLESIQGDNKTFSVTVIPGASSNVPTKTWTATSTGDAALTVSDTSDIKDFFKDNEYLFGNYLDEAQTIYTAYTNFSGTIPQNTESAKMMFSYRIGYNMAEDHFLGGVQAESTTMTTHLYITSYDKASLREAVANAEQAGFNSEYFNSKTYEAYENALKTAKEVLGKAETNQAEVDEATAALNTAIADLTKAENEAKFVLTVTHSIHKGDLNSEIYEPAPVDYYLANGDVTPDYTDLTGKTINKYDDKVTINVTEDKTHTYNYWYINYSGVQGAIAEAQNIIDNADKYDPDFVTAVTNAKNALEVIKNGESATTTPESQDDVDNAIKAVTNLTGHGCADKDTDHDCDICGATIGTHEDVDPEDHDCDYCGGKITDCADTDKNHKCDICGATMGTHEDVDPKDHNCDYCGGKITDCVDADNNHKCDVCDATLSECADEDKNHKCDICGATIGTHEDVAPEDHNCDYCGGKITDCADTDKNHKCDICGATMGTHADSATDSDHVCDYGCGVTLENCTDVDTDTDHNCDICGAENVTSHNYVNPVLTRPTKNEDGTWKKGYYTSTCNCGATKTETAARADYEAYDEAKAALKALLNDTTITGTAKAEIEAVLEANKIADNYIATEEEQAIVDAAAAALKAELDKLTDEEGKLEDEYKKPDYTKWEEAETAYDALDMTNVKSDIIAEAEGLKKQIADKQADDSLTQATATQTEINNATARLNQIIAGINNGTMKNPDYSDAENAIQNAKNTADSENIPDNKELEIEAEIAELERQLEELKNTNPDSTNAEANEKIEEIKGKAEAIVNKYVDCVAGTHNYADATCTSPKTCKECGVTDGEANGHDWGEGWKLTLAPTKETEGTYTRVCTKGDATETKSVAREDYSAYDEAIKKAEELLKKDELTQAAKDLIEAAITEAKKLEQNLPEDVVENGETIIDNDSAEKIAEATKVITDAIASLYDENGNLKKEYEKVDYTNYNAAVNAAKALENVMTPEDKAAVEAAKKTVTDAGITEETTKADGQKTLDDAAAAIAAINAKYGDCVNSNHTWGTPVLTKKPTATEQGEYTETCGICGTTQITKVDLANYQEFDAVVEQLEALANTKNLTNAAAEAIADALTEAEELNKNLPADATTADGKLIKGGQEEINALVEELKKVVADTNAAITSGSALKPDYKAWEEAEAAYDALDKTNVKSEIITEANNLKEQIAAKQAVTSHTQATATQKDINDATTRLNQIIAGINNGTMKTPDYSGVENAIQSAKDTADDEDIPDSKEAEIEAAIAEFERLLEELKETNPDSTDTEALAKIEEIKKAAEDIVETYKNCAKGNHTDAMGDDNHNCDTCGKADVTEHDYADATCTAPKTCNECGATDGSALEHADSDNDHICNNGCGNKISDCTDTDKNHNCDICGTELSECDDKNNDHNCDVCGDKLSDCSDVETDTDHDCDICGAKNITEHNYVDPELTRPTQKADGTWSDGYYTSTCNCGATKTETAARADYEAYDEAKAALKALLNDTTITGTAKAEIEAVLEANKIADNYIATEEEQSIVDAAANALKAELEKLTNEDGSLKDEYKKPDAECTHTDCAEKVVAPTCHSLGYTLHVCKNCGYAYRTDEQPATDDHKWGRWFETESGSCLEYRMHERSCLNEGCHEKQIEIMRDANGDALYGKHYVVVIKGQAATCVAPGYTDYERCVVCGEITEAEVIPATGHIDNNKNGNCDVCNYVTNPSIGKCDCLCHNDSFFGKLLYNFVNFFWKLFKIQQGCQCGAQHW